MRVACVQMNSQGDMEANIRQGASYIDEAVSEGADFILLPENVALMAEDFKALRACSYAMDEHPALLAFADKAKQHEVWILIGSLACLVPGEMRLANRSILLDHKGNVAAFYDKMHLYDVRVDGGESHEESARFIAGIKHVVANTPWGGLGMSVCFDVRFPHLYRRLAQDGAWMHAVPSAFTAHTGQAHWHVLLRARAIETGSYVLAPAQVGRHPKGRATFGHALVVDPWGTVLADARQEEGVIVADIDQSKSTSVRQQIPVL